MSDMNNQTVEQPVNFDAIKIGLASPELIRQWSHGEYFKAGKRWSVLRKNFRTKQGLGMSLW